MPEPRTFQIAMEEAEQAAQAGDAAGAESLLREALRLQHEALGPTHVDLASTLNNLAVVCESNGKLDDAEAFYRRAYAVASSSRPAGDPLVITSRDNLRDFCAARSRSMEDWPGIGEPETSTDRISVAQAMATAAAASAGVALTPRPAMPERAVDLHAPEAVEPPRRESPARPLTTPPPPTQPAPAEESLRPWPPADAVVGRDRVEEPFDESVTRPLPSPPPRAWPMGLIAAVVVAAVVGGVWLWRPGATPGPGGVAPDAAPAGSTPGAASSAATAPERPDTPPGGVTPRPDAAPVSPRTAAPPVAPPEAAAPSESGDASRAEPAVTATPAAADRPATDPAAAGDDVVAITGVRVVTAAVCSELTPAADWRCVPLATPGAPGRASFFTRVASPVPLRVEHRWYQDGALRQRVVLAVGANASEGYRTFSRQTVSTGSWRLEVRTAGGPVLHETTFDVR